MSMQLDFKNIDFKNLDMKDSNTQKVLLVFLIGAAALALYIYFVFVPQVTRGMLLVKKMGKVKEQLDSAKLTIAQMEPLKKKLGDYKEKVELYEKRLPVEHEIPSLLESLSNMAKDSNIKITSIMPVASYSKEGATTRPQGGIYQEIPILITAKSGYHELGYFLSNLENSDRFMKVVDIGIRANSTSPKRHDIDLMVCTYILLPEKK